MSNLKMILFDGTALEIEAFGLPMHAVMQCKDKDEVMSIWELMTEENLKSVIVTQDGESMFAYKDGMLDGVQTVDNGDRTMTVHFYMKGKRQEILSDESADYITAAKILLGEEE